MSPLQCAGDSHAPTGPRNDTVLRKSLQNAGVVELADTLDLGSNGFPCKFKSCRPYQEKAEGIRPLLFLQYSKTVCLHGAPLRQSKRLRIFWMITSHW